MSGLIAAGLLRLQDLFVEPAAAVEPVEAPPPRGSPQSPAPDDLETVVVGLSPGCGTSTVARGLALVLSNACRASQLIVVAAADPQASSRCGPIGVWNVPGALDDPAEIAQYGGMAARMAGGRGTGASAIATVWDVPAAAAPLAAKVMADVGRIVLVAAGDADPVLAGTVADMLAERHGRVLLVANRGRAESWPAATACLPDARIAARAVARGRLPSGALSAGLAQLARGIEQAV